MDTPFFLGLLAVGGGGSGPPPGGTWAGTIKLEAGEWQTVAVPMVFGYWDTGTGAIVLDGITRSRISNVISDQLIDKYGAGCVEVVSSKSGDETSWRSYTPGVTPDESVDDPPLMTEEGTDNYEPLGLLIKSNYGSTMHLEYAT